MSGVPLEHEEEYIPVVMKFPSCSYIYYEQMSRCHTSSLTVILMYAVLRWTEPIILLLIIFNAVVLTIQAARGIAPLNSDSHLQTKGYFQGWEDHALFVLFIVFT